MLRVLAAWLIPCLALAGEANLSWVVPTTRTDGAAYTNPAGYRIWERCGTDPTALLATVAATENTYQRLNIPDDGRTCFWSLTAFDLAGVESARTNEVTKTFAIGLPSSPSNLVIAWTGSQGIPGMAEPTFVEYDESTFSDNGTTDELTSSISWQTGDIILVFGAVSNNITGNTLGVPTVTGLTFSQLASVNVNNDNNDTTVYLWSATAASNGSGQIASVTGTGNDSIRSGIAAMCYRGSDGLGTPVTMDGSTAKTISVTRVGANSHVALMMADWNQVGDVTVDATPTGTVRHASAQTGQADFFVVTFGDQGAAGTTSYGITNHTGTVDMSGIAVEIKGTAGGAPAASFMLNHMMQQH